ncbi:MULTISPECIES: hypothetical protein [Streptosporangium]|uniref:Uncharacterized protein n=1 Tax=Streptosporangium brasiliense TaxID=47480 RepID=A0ABT9RME4_9ACTN|nr:hypothetical protein [Streptosporangium brasiliense]MDP9870453.1 hypothetical protein [Streptosporangium brasiliense]
MVILAVAGAAPITGSHIDDLLSDFLLVDTDEAREFAVYLPADRALTTTAVLETAKWLEEFEDVGYIAVTGGNPGRKGKPILSDADDEIGEDGQDVAEHLVKILADAVADGHEAYLLLAWGDSDDAPDEHTQRLLDLAAAAGVKAKDLTMGLDDLGFDDDDEEEDDEEEDEPPAKKKKKKDAEQIELTEPEIELGAGDEAQAELPGYVDPQPADDEQNIPDLQVTLAFVFELLTYQDRANAANHLTGVVYRPLTKAVRYHMQKLVNALGEAPTPDPEPAQEEPAPAARRRGKARDIDADMVDVYIDEAKGSIRLISGRGRPRKGEAKDTIPRSEFERIKKEFAEME